MTAKAFALFETPIGTCAITWSGARIAGFQLPEGGAEATRRRVRNRQAGAVESVPPPAIQHAIERVQALLRGEPVDLSEFEVDLGDAPEFNRKVYEVARTIPPGRTMTYGEIARKIGVGPEMARDVGQALGRNPVAVFVPCHRVLAASGKMGCFSATGGVSTKRRMLEIEGAAALGAGPLFQR